MSKPNLNVTDSRTSTQYEIPIENSTIRAIDLRPIKQDPDEAGDPTFPTLAAKSPIRFRLGDRLSQDGKFINGYFEFHLFTQDYETKTKADIPKTEKNFLIRLYKVYPGYDTGAPTEEGLSPMVDPFTTG